MREPNPTPAELWSHWEPRPSPPLHWPGLEPARADGLEIDRTGVRSVAGKLVKLAAAAPAHDYLYASVLVLPDTHWPLPRELSEVFNLADAAVHTFWKDLHMEVGMAGLLIERCSTRYDLGEQPLLGDIPIAQLDKRLVGMMPGDAPSSVLGEPSERYPVGRVTLELRNNVDYSVGQITAEQAKEDIASFPRNDGLQQFHHQIAESLVELAHAVWGHSQDLRQSPWHGAAADKAQEALRQIYGNVTCLAAFCGRMGDAIARFKEVTDWCRKNFEQQADPDRGGWDEFWDLGGTADSRTRAFLAEADIEFMKVYEMMPKYLQEDLPGLLVTDQSLAEFQARADMVRTRPKDSEWLTHNDREWLAHYVPLLHGYERAEKNYG